jgi:RNA polymerase sigma-70 factor (ECF subfamily)
MNLGSTTVEMSMPADNTDQAVNELVEGARGGDSRSFEALYHMHTGRVHALCLRLTGDPTLAESLTQDVFVKVWRKLDTFRAEGPFAAWLRRLTVNVVLEDRRSARRESKWLAADGDSLLQAGAGSTSSAEPDRVMDLERAMARLPRGARTAFVLHDVEGFRHREIAAITGLAEGTIKAQLHRARKLLRTAMETKTVSREVRK